MGSNKNRKEGHMKKSVLFAIVITLTHAEDREIKEEKDRNGGRTCLCCRELDNDELRFLCLPPVDEEERIRRSCGKDETLDDCITRLESSSAERSQTVAAELRDIQVRRREHHEVEEASIDDGAIAGISALTALTAALALVVI